MSTKPRELDIDLNRMRAEKIDQLRSLMRDLDDLDAVERVLNGQTHQIAMTASLTITNGQSNGNGANGHGKLIAAAQHLIDEDEPVRTRPAAKRKQERANLSTLMPQILAVLRVQREPVQAGDLRTAVEKRFESRAAQSTYNRALVLLREQKQIVKLMPPGGHYPHYQIRDGAAPPEKKHIGGVKRGAKRGPYKKSTRGHADPNSVSTGVLRVLADGDPNGMTIPEITKILEHDGHTEFLREHARNAQVSWALKGHRERHRIKTTVRSGGVRYHQLIRPQFSVTKEPEAALESPISE